MRLLFVSKIFPFFDDLFYGKCTHPLKGGYRKFFYSFISPVGHNIWWENSRNGPFGPKNDPKTQIWPF